MQVCAANTQHTRTMEAPSGVKFEALLSLLFAALRAPAPPRCLQHHPSPSPGVTEQIYGLRNEMNTYITGWRKRQLQYSPCRRVSYDFS